MFVICSGAASAAPNLDAFKETWKYKALELQRDLTKHYSGNKRFNVRTHNSYNTAMYKNSALSVAYADPQQKLTMTGQLDMGARYVNIDAHYAHGDVRMCHWGGPAELRQLFCSPSDKSFGDGIGEIATWLLRPENQNEVVFLYIQNEVENETGYRIAADVLQSYEDLIYVPGGDGCNNAFNQSMTLDQIAATGRRLVIDMPGNRDLCSGSIAAREYASMTVHSYTSGEAYNHVINNTSSSQIGDVSGLVWDNNWNPETCTFSNDSITPSRLQTGVPSASEDRTNFAVLGGESYKQHTYEEIRDLTNCGVNIEWDDLSPEDERLDVYLWAWAINEPNNYNGNEHCGSLAQKSGNKFNDAVCDTEFNYMCQHVNDPIDWKMTTAKGSWADGFAACASEFGNEYRFSVPKDGYEKNVAVAVRDQGNAASAWVNYTDQHAEGQWQPADHPSVYWAMNKANLWNANEPNNYNGQEDCAQLKNSTGLNDTQCSKNAKALCYMDAGTAHGEGNWAISEASGNWFNAESACQAINGRFMMPADMAALNSAKAVASASGVNALWVNYSDIATEGNWLGSLLNLDEIRPEEVADYQGRFNDGFARLRTGHAYCLDVEGGNGNVKQGTDVHQWACHNNRSQWWKMFPDKSIRPYLNQNLCLDVNGHRTENGTGVSLWGCNGSAAQQWEFRSYNALVNLNSNKALDFDQPWLLNGRDAHIWDINNNPWQRFHWDGFQPAEGIKLKVGYNHNYCLDVSGTDSNANNANVQIWNCNEVTETWHLNEKMQLVADWNSSVCLDASGTNPGAGANVGIYNCAEVTETWNFLSNGQIQARWDPNLCLDIEGNYSTTSGTNVGIWHCYNHAERWALPEEDVYRMLVDQNTGLCLDVTFGKATNGNTTWLWPCDGGKAQLWRYDSKTGFMHSKVGDANMSTLR